LEGPAAHQEAEVVEAIKVEKETRSVEAAAEVMRVEVGGRSVVVVVAKSG
jgi:hypothetical protein